MADRRLFIQGGVSLAGLAALPLPVALAAPRGTSAAGALPDPLLVVVDDHLAGSAVLAAEAAEASYPVLHFVADVAGLWMSQIEPRLREGPLAIAGHTSAATLFCLELLARDYGARAVARLEPAREMNGPLLGSLTQRSAPTRLEPLVVTMGAAPLTWLVASGAGSRGPLVPVRRTDIKG